MMHAMGVRTQIIGMAFVSLAGTLIVIEAYDDAIVEALATEARASAEALSEAMEVSVKQLGPDAEPDQAILRDSAEKLGGSGIREITVLGPEKERLAGSHAYLIGEESKQAFELLVPIVVGPDKLGYVEIKMSSFDLEAKVEALRAQRMLVAALVFALGLAFSYVVAQKIARPMEERERDAMIGRVAASIAHDIRNPLSFLSLAVDHLVESTGKDAANAEIGAQMKSEIRRANDRIAELLRLGKPVEIVRAEVEVETLLRAAAENCGRPIEVRAEKVGSAWWDAAVVGGILRNLLTNAIQAADGGEIVLSAETRGERVAVHVDDRGPGLDAVALARLFEPYFTTKESGVGIGLVIARRAARDHGGDLSAANREGGGARFTLLLPRGRA